MTGMCSTIQAARNSGLATEEEVDAVLKQAVTDISGAQPEIGDINGTVESCSDFMGKYGQK